MNKKVETGAEIRAKLLKGINTLADAVTATLGPNGRNVIYVEHGEVRSTKDGVSVANQISNLEDPTENLGVEMIKQTSIKTANNAGDGTTTSTLLAQNMVNEGVNFLNKGSNAVEIKRGIDEAVSEVIQSLKTNQKEDISSQNQLTQIASISANNDEEIGNLIATSLEKVGREGVVHIEESKTGETYLETVEGMQFDRGYKSHYFVTNNNDMTCTLEEPLVLIVDKKITAVKELLPILTKVSELNKSLLIVSEDLDGEALSTLIVNKMRGTIKVCAVKAPDYGDRRKLIMEDMAILTGGTVVSSEKGMKLDKFDFAWFGEARISNIGKDQTTIIDGKGTEEKIAERIESIKQQIDKATVPFEKEKLQERLAKFVGGVAIVHVGGYSELEMKEKKDRVDDALHATKAAIEEGIVAGGGTALLAAREDITFDKKNTTDFNIGKEIVYKACSSPFIKILTNAGYTNEKCYKLINQINKSKAWVGYNLKTEKFVDFKDAGIIDPFKVTRCALENAASIAGTLLLTEAAIVEIKDKEEVQPQPNMGGMY